MDRAEEFAAKRERLRGWLDGGGYSAVLLRTRANIAWLGCGPADGVALDGVQGSRSEIWSQTETGVMVFLVTPDEAVLVTENIELPRLARDEFSDVPLEVMAQPWHESDVATAARDTIGSGGRVACDLVEPPLAASFRAVGLDLVDERDAIAGLRAELLPRELERYRWLGRAASNAMTAVCRDVRPGLAEAEVVANAHARLHRLGIDQAVDIVCSDDRLQTDRHGLYSDRRIKRATMVVFCARKWGLVANLTRMVHVGEAPRDLVERHRALAAFDRRIMDATRPGVALRDIFNQTVVPGYAALGEADAWRDHHQGGSTGYTGRDQRVTPATEGVARLHQAFAWNPSLPGVKSEDTFVVGETGPEVLTLDDAWPVYPDSGRPMILELA